MRAGLLIIVLPILLLACADSASNPASPAKLSVSLDKSGVETLDGDIMSWTFNLAIHNTGPDSLDLRYFIHAETPTGDISHRGVYPLAARRALTERTKRMDFGKKIEEDLLSRGAEIKLEPGESRIEEGGIILRSNQTTSYSDLVLFVYNKSGERVGQFQLTVQEQL